MVDHEPPAESTKPVSPVVLHAACGLRRAPLLPHLSTWLSFEPEPNDVSGLPFRASLARCHTPRLAGAALVSPPEANGSGSRYSDEACELCSCRVLGAAVDRPECTPIQKGNRRRVEHGHCGYLTVVMNQSSMAVIFDRSIEVTSNSWLAWLVCGRALGSLAATQTGTSSHAGDHERTPRATATASAGNPHGAAAQGPRLSTARIRPHPGGTHTTPSRPT